MIGVCIPYTNLSWEQQNWDYLLSNFKPDVIYVWGDENIKLPNTNVLGKSLIVRSWAKLPQDIPFVFLSPSHAHRMPGVIPLIEFEHPTNAIYIVGTNNLFADETNFESGKLPEHKVFIPTDTKDDMFNWTAMTVALYDRRIKKWLTR